MKRSNIMLVISSPSGCGKTTLSYALLKKETRLRRSISVTTRPPREGEIDGKDYYFVSEEKFTGMVAQNRFLEYAKVFDHSYGTPKDQTESLFKQSLDVMYVIDWQGGLRLMQTARKEIVSIFILPPSLAILKERLWDRASDSSSEIRKRLSIARSEMDKCKYYDYIIINDKFEHAVAQLNNILQAERSKRERQDLEHLLASLE